MDIPIYIETMRKEIENDKMTRNRLKDEEDENDLKSLSNDNFK